jgi:hypothetical protein
MHTLSLTAVTPALLRLRHESFALEKLRSCVPRAKLQVVAPSKAHVPREAAGGLEVDIAAFGNPHQANRAGRPTRR